MAPASMDRFTAAGIAATWWEQSFYELQTAANRGWKTVIDAWLTTTEASKDDKKAPNLADQTVIKLLAAPQLAQRTVLAAEHARLDTEIKTAEASNDEEDQPDNAPTPTEIKKLKSARTKTKKNLKAIDASLLAVARQTLNAMPPVDAPTQAIGVLRSRIREARSRPQRHHRTQHPHLVRQPHQQVRHQPSANLEAERDAAAARLDQHLKELGYG